MSNIIAKAAVSIDDLVSGNFIAAPTLTAIISGATALQQAALAAELDAIADATPGPIVAEELELDTGTKTAAAVAGAATLNKSSGVVTSEALTTAAGSEYALTLTNSKIAAGDIVVASVQLGTATTGEPQITTITPAAGSVVIKAKNIAGSAALNGTIVISYAVFKAGAPS